MSMHVDIPRQHRGALAFLALLGLLLAFAASLGKQDPAPEPEPAAQATAPAPPKKAAKGGHREKTPKLVSVNTECPGFKTMDQLDKFTACMATGAHFRGDRLLEDLHREGQCVMLTPAWQFEVVERRAGAVLLRVHNASAEWWTLEKWVEKAE